MNHSENASLDTNFNFLKEDKNQLFLRTKNPLIFKIIDCINYITHINPFQNLVKVLKNKFLCVVLLPLVKLKK